MLNSPRSTKVLDAIFKAALDDEHKNQAAAWKIIVDRIVPVSGFEKEAGALRQNAITVNITGVEGVSIGAADASIGDSRGDVIEGEAEETEFTDSVEVDDV